MTILLQAKRQGARDWLLRRTFTVTTETPEAVQATLVRARRALNMWQSIEPTTELRILCP